MFAEANNPHRSLRRRYDAVDSQRSLPNVDCRDVVCRASEPAEYTVEFVPSRTVGFVDVVAGRAGSARIARINQQHRNSTKSGLIRNKATQFVKSPIAQSFPLSPCGLDTIADAFEVFESNRTSPAFGFRNDGLGDAMVGVPLEARLLPRGTFESAFCRPRSKFLQGATTGFIASSDNFNLRSAEGIAIAVAGEIDDTQVNAKHIGGSEGLLRFNVAGQSEHPLAANKHKIGFAFGERDTFALILPAAIGNNDSTFERPDRNCTIEHTKDARIERLRGVAMESSLRGLAASLEAVSNLRNRAHRSLRRQSETLANLGVNRTVYVKLSAPVGSVCLFRYPVAGRITCFQRVTQQPLLFRVRKQTNWRDELHLAIFLSLNVTPYNGIGYVTYRTRVITTTPQSRQAGAKSRELLSEYATRLSFKPIHNFSNAEGGIALDKHVYMVRHHFHRVNGYIVLTGNLTKNRLKPDINRGNENPLSVFRAPDKVILEAKYSPRIHRISRRSFHSGELYMRHTSKPDCAPHNSLSLRQLKQAVSRESL
jgi:hypothetical protein